MKTPHALLLVFTVATVVCLGGTLNHSLFFPDEIRVGEIGREMYVSGDLVVPTLAGERFIEKPPLYWWAMNGLFELFGVSDGVARSTSALACILLALVVFDLARRIAGLRAGVYAALVLVTTAGLFGSLTLCLVDSWLALLVGAGYWAYVCGALESASRDGHFARRWVLLIALFAGLAVLTKGPVGLVLLCGPVGIDLLRRRQVRSFLRSPGVAGGAILACALVLSWPFLLWCRDPEILRQYLLQNVLLRFVRIGEVEYAGGHTHPFWYYLTHAPGLLLPWIVAAPALSRMIRSDRSRNGIDRRMLGFLAWVFPVGVLLLSLPSTKRGIYVLPLIAPFAGAVGIWIARCEKAPISRVDRVTWGALVGALLAAAGALLLLELHPLYPTALLDILGRAAEWDSVRAAPPGLFGLLGLGALIAGGTAVVSWSSRFRRVPMAVIAGLVLLVVSFNAFAYPLINSRHSPDALTSDLAAVAGFPSSVVGYRLDEATRAAVPLRTGMYLADLPSTGELLAYLERHPDALFLSFDRSIEGLPPALKERVHVVRHWDLLRHRDYSLLQFRRLSAPGGREAPGVGR